MSAVEKMMIRPMKEMGVAWLKGMSLIQKTMLRAQAEIYKGCLGVVEETIRDLDKIEKEEVAHSRAVKKPEKVSIV